METHFPSDIKLPSPPLGEAWVELRWHLEEVGPPGMLQDPHFAFALGSFFTGVRERYPHKVDLEASRMPLEMLPHMVRHQFWSGEREWPVLQLGPGVATVNFTRPYTWDAFKAEALYLRSKLVDAYSEVPLQLDNVNLRYINAEPFEFPKHDALEFIRSNLNTTLVLPEHIPGRFASIPIPTSLNLQATFDLKVPKGTGTIVLATDTRSIASTLGNPNSPTKVVTWQLGVASGGDDAPDIRDEAVLSRWLDQAHSAIHEWFFSFIAGRLYQRYSGKGD